MGLMTPSQGRITWGSTDGEDVPPTRRAVVFQRPAMPSTAGLALAILRYALQAFGASRERAQKVGSSELLALVGLGEHLTDRPALRLSGGEQQLPRYRARSPATPSFCFLDEPT